jgi:hypothetical protein
MHFVKKNKMREKEGNEREERERKKEIKKERIFMINVSQY